MNYLASWLSGLWVGVVAGLICFAVGFCVRYIRDALR